VRFLKFGILFAAFCGFSVSTALAEDITYRELVDSASGMIGGVRFNEQRVILRAVGVIFDINCIGGGIGELSCVNAGSTMFPIETMIEIERPGQLPIIAKFMQPTSVFVLQSHCYLLTPCVGFQFGKSNPTSDPNTIILGTAGGFDSYFLTDDIMKRGLAIGQTNLAYTTDLGPLSFSLISGSSEFTAVNEPPGFMPEPPIITLLGTGLFCLAGLSLRRKRS